MKRFGIPLMHHIDEESSALASLYAAGALDRAERVAFERRMRNDPKLSALVADLCDAATEMAYTEAAPLLQPPPAVRDHIFERIREIPIDILRAFDLRDDEGFVMTNADGLIQWVNSEFTSMCGYRLEELKGRKPGHVLQGPATNPTTVETMRQAFWNRRPVTVEVVNYHKNGNPYWVSISMSPVLDETGEPRCYVAIEREIADRDIPVMLA